MRGQLRPSEFTCRMCPSTCTDPSSSQIEPPCPSADNDVSTCTHCKPSEHVSALQSRICAFKYVHYGYQQLYSIYKNSRAFATVKAGSQMPHQPLASAQPRQRLAIMAHTSDRPYDAWSPLSTQAAYVQFVDVILKALMNGCMYHKRIDQH